MASSLNTLWNEYLRPQTGTSQSMVDMERAFWNSLASTTGKTIPDAQRIALENLGFSIATYGSTHDQLKAYWNSVIPNTGFMTAWLETLKAILCASGIVLPV